MTSLAERGGILMTMHGLSQGGGDRVAVILANGFADAGIPTHLALLRDSSTADKELGGMLHPDVSISSAGPALGSRLRELRRGAAFIGREIAAHRPAIVLASSSNMAFVTARAGKRGGRSPKLVLKLTVPVAAPPDRGAFRRFYRRNLFGWIFKRYDLALTLTDAEGHWLIERYPALEGRFRTVPNAYITDAMLAVSPPRPEGPPRLVTAGRMLKQKRHDILLRAFALSARKDARLTILGDGPWRGQLEELGKSLGIADRVDMPGYTGDVLPQLRRSDLFVLSSDYEGLPAVVLEALACNVPVATTDNFLGAREMLESEPSCAVVPIQNSAALAGAIDRCLEASSAPRDLRSIAAPYRIDASIAAHIAVLNDLVEQSSLS
jgi:glycosyltransferase involved in cell wall biosynthesis